MNAVDAHRRSAAHLAWARAITFAAALAPGLWLALGWPGGWLGVNPLNTLLHVSGQSAVTLLLLTLAVTPARRLSVWVSRAVALRFGRRMSDWNWLLRLRRPLGLFSCFYASLHVALYAGLDAGLDWAAMSQDLQERPSLLLGLFAWAALLPLAATSNQASMRRLGKGWRLLHCLAYPAAVLAVLHFCLQTKVGDHAAWPYAAVLAGLLLVRLLGKLRGDSGEPVQDRVAATGPASQAAPMKIAATEGTSGGDHLQQLSH